MFVLRKKLFLILKYWLELHPLLGCVWYWCLVVLVDALIVQGMHLWHLKSSTLHAVLCMPKTGWAPRASSWQSCYSDPSFWMVKLSVTPDSHLVPFVFCSINTTIQNIGQMQSVGGKHEFGLKYYFFTSGNSFSLNHYPAEHSIIWHTPPPLCECLEDT